MSYSLLDVDGETRLPSKADRISGLDDEDLTLYVVEVKPFAHTEDSFELIDPTPIRLDHFLYMADQAVPAYATGYVFKADVHWKVGKKWDPKTGSNTTVSIGYLCAAHKPGPYKRKGLKIVFTDTLDGLLFPNEYVVTFHLVTYPDRDRMGNNGDPVIQNRNLNCEMVEMQAGCLTAHGIMLVEGLAMIRISRDQMTQAEALGPDNYFNISISGEPATRWMVWNGDGGGQQGMETVREEKTHQLSIYLKRVI